MSRQKGVAFLPFTTVRIRYGWIDCEEPVVKVPVISGRYLWCFVIVVGITRIPVQKVHRHIW